MVTTETAQIPVSRAEGDLAWQYNSFLETSPVVAAELAEGDIVLQQDGKLRRAARLPNGLYKFREGTNTARVVLDCVASSALFANVLGFNRVRADESAARGGPAVDRDPGPGPRHHLLPSGRSPGRGSVR